VGNGLVVAGELRDCSHAGQAVFRNWADTDPHVLDLRAFERWDHPPGTLQQLLTEGVLRHPVVFELLINRTVMHHDALRTIGA
jgi:hypothetical protein